MRLSFVESVPTVILAVIPGFRSAIVALRPFTLISVNCVMANVLLALFSVTVTLFAVTAEIVGGWFCGGGDGFFFEAAKAGLDTSSPIRMAMIRKGDDFITYFL